MKRSLIIMHVLVAFLVSCQSEQDQSADPDPEKRELPDWKKPEKLGYELKDANWWLQDSSVGFAQRAIVFAVNRMDSAHVAKSDSIIVPVDLTGYIVYYLPFPLEVPFLRDVDKIVFFSYPAQAFAAYENGVLVHTGPTNMGSEKHVTPTGLFYTNWKAKKTISTFNDEWELKWNFNLINKAGVGWHQYTMPGYPASHSCLRLLEKDAKYLYTWADQWVLADKTTISVKGTPVLVFGAYDFKAPKPWLRLVRDPHALDISEEELERLTEPFLDQIFTEQENREAYEAGKKEIP